MLTVKEAVQAAQKWVRELYAEPDLRHLRLEEVELSDDETTWNITLGWAEPAVPQNPLIPELNGDFQRLPRVYKSFEIDAETGEVRSMRIREVA